MRYYFCIAFHFEIFLNGPAPASSLFIFVLFKQCIAEKTTDLSEIQTRIVEVEGEHTDHFSFDI